MQPDISPLAKRLAEENNVEWQGLYGSGSDGRIVERDVLEYLARVMAGEEDLNPTPEPLPAGMEAWPEEVSARATASKSSQAPVQVVANAEPTADELLLETDESFGTPTARMPRVEINRAASADEHEETINDDIFLFDLENEDLENEAVSYESGVQDDDRALELQNVPDTLFTEDDAFAESVIDAEETSDEASDDLNLSFDLGDTATENADTEADMAPNTRAASDFSFDTDFGESPDTESAPQTAEFGVLSSYKTQDDADMDEDDFEMVAAAATKAPNLSTANVALFDEAATDDAEDETSLFLNNAENMAQDETLYKGTTEDTLEEDAFTLDPSTKNDLENAEGEAAEAPQEGQAAPSLVSYGLLLRRHVDLSEFRRAQAAVGQELAQAGPVEPGSLLLRAAAKALSVAPLNGQGTVGLAVFGDRAVQVAAVPDILTRPFREVVSEVARPDTETGQGSSYTVIVADMSEFDIDEAVLNAGAPVLTLGRVLPDGSAGRHLSTLSLSGQVTVEEGTKFLAAVAELLATPIRLVV